MNFLKQYYDKLVALIALLFVVGALFFLVFKIREIREGFKTNDPIPTKIPEVKRVPFEPVEQLAVTLENPAQWQSNMHRLFQPPLMRVGEDGYPERATDKLGPVTVKGLSIEWLKRYDLDLRDPQVGGQDPDSDGYTNEEEFEGDSDPLDAQSKPSPANKLRVVKRYRKDFPYLFVAYSESSDKVYQVQMNSDKGKTEMIGEGQGFGGGYKLLKLIPKIEKRFNARLNATVEEDASTLLIVDKNGQEIVLEKGKRGKTAETFALLIYLRDAKEFEVSEGETFQLEATPFKVDKIVPLAEKNEVDVSSGLVVITTVTKGVPTTYALKVYNPKEDRKGDGGTKAEQPKQPVRAPPQPAPITAPPMAPLK